MRATYALHQEDRIFFGHIERSLLSLLERRDNTPRQNEALVALLTGLWNLPRLTPGLNCSLEYAVGEASMRFEINQECVSFSYGADFHASFWLGEGNQHVGSRWGERHDRWEDYHSWKVLLQMFENDLRSGEVGFTVELFGRPSLEMPVPWAGLPSWAAKGVRGLTEIGA